MAEQIRCTAWSHVRFVLELGLAILLLPVAFVAEKFGWKVRK